MTRSPLPPLTQRERFTRSQRALFLLAFAATACGATVLTACDQTDPVPDNARAVDSASIATTRDSSAGTVGVGRLDSLTGVMPPDSAAGASTGVATPAPLPVSDTRMEVDLAARRVRVIRGTDTLATHPVAVGMPEWPTRTGEWYVTQVIWNPEWVPPEESWAEKEEPKAPGAPDNPLGEAQLVYDPPRSIHGTNEPRSVGKAVSHGSIRVTNTVARSLAKLLMEETGIGRDSSWYAGTRQNRREKVVIDLPERVPIRVY